MTPEYEVTLGPRKVRVRAKSKLEARTSALAEVFGLNAFWDTTGAPIGRGTVYVQKLRRRGTKIFILSEKKGRPMRCEVKCVAP